MASLMLRHAVHDIDNRLILPGGTILSPENINSVIPMNQEAYQSIPILEYSSIKNDLFVFLEDNPAYQVIFDNPEIKFNLLNMMGLVKLPLPLLQSLEYFKQYDLYTYRHSLMVFALSANIAYMLADHEELIKWVTSGPIHDIGKTCIPLNILRKITPLTRTEIEILKHHTVSGYVLSSFYYQKAGNFAARSARDHHERKNGSGYPCGIRLNDRMVEIVVVCDVYDALISPRPYRPVSYDNRSALEEITSMAAQGEISVEVVQALVASNRKNHPHFMECRISKEKRGIQPDGNLYGKISEDEN